MANEDIQNQVEETQTAPEPVDIAEAFKMYNQANAKPAEESVSDSEPGEPADNSEGDGEQPVPSLEGGDIPEDSEPSGDFSTEPTLDGEDGDDDGGSTTVIEPIDSNAAKQNMLRNIQQQAINNVRKKMTEQQIEHWSINDIYERDEETGRVTFHNPDDPNRPFESRAAAQAFIDAMNKNVDEFFRAEVNKEQQELVRNAAPALQVIDFADTYNSMSKAEREVFDELVEPYAIRGNNGKVIGFNTNLQSAANVAKRVAGRFASAKQPGTPAQAGKKKPQATDAGSRPATDLPTGSSQSGEAPKEPKTLGEALKMFDQQNKKGNK